MGMFRDVVVKYLCKAKREKAISATDAMPDPAAM